MGKSVYVLYVGDAWLSRSSLSVMGVFSTLYGAIDSVLKNEHCSADEREEIKRELYTNRQTQCMDNNWLITECVMDEYGEV